MFENDDLRDLSQEQRNLLRDVMRHGSMGGVPSRTYSRLDLSRLQAFDGPRSVPDISEFEVDAADLFDLDDLGIEEATREYVRRQEAAILSTEWDEWDIVDLVEWVPVTPTDPPSFEVHRYKDRAPKVSEYATGTQRYSVTRVTRPLLERIFRELRAADRLPERYEPYADELDL